MYSSYITQIDPAILQNRFSDKDKLEPLPEGLCEEWKALHMGKVRAVLERLPEREHDLVYLYYIKNKKQTDIAEIFGITQAAVSYRLKRAIKRLKLLVAMPDLDQDTLRDYMVKIFDSQLDAEIYVRLYRSSCQSEVAKMLDISQGRVRQRFITNLVTFGHFVETLLEGCVFEDCTEEEIEVYDQALQEVRRASQERAAFEAAKSSSSLNKKEWKSAYEALAKDYEDAMLRLREVCEEYEVCEEDTMLYFNLYRVYVTLRYNFNILREVVLPRWQKRSANFLA